MNLIPNGERPHEINVSVIIPTYNRGSLITEAVESVLDQTVPGIEVIVVDDGSTDDTLQRLAPYRDRITIIRTNHGGAPHARNAGIKVARGKYIAFLDSDDRYLAHKLALQVAVLDRYPDVGLVYSEFSSIGEAPAEEFHLKTYHAPAFRNGESYRKYFTEAVSLKEAGIECPPWSDRMIYFGDIFDQYLRVLFVFVNSAMVRRAVLDSVGLHDEHLSLFDGYDLVLRIAKQHRIAFVDVPTYQLRYHDDQISTTKRTDGPLVFIAKQRQLLQIVERHGVQDRPYYESHKSEVDATVGRLQRALGLALMGHPGNEREARQCFAESRRYGLSVQDLWLLTFFPSILRRIAMKLRELVV